MDDKTRKLIGDLYPKVGVALYRTIEDMKRINHRAMRVTEGVRSIERQAELYAKGRTAPGSIVTNSKPGMSWHHYGLAADLCFDCPDPFLEKMDPKESRFLWNDFGKFAEYHGLTWGGKFRTFPDRPHVQMTFGLTLQEAIQIFETGGLSGIFLAVDKFHG